MLEILICLICLALIGMNILTVWYYQKQIATLVDKAMSRSYPEYVQTKNLEQADHFPKVSTQESQSVSNDAVLDDLNRMFT
jgi:hypothetical protein